MANTLGNCVFVNKSGQPMLFEKGLHNLNEHQCCCTKACMIKARQCKACNCNACSNNNNKKKKKTKKNDNTNNNALLNNKACKPLFGVFAPLS